MAHSLTNFERREYCYEEGCARGDSTPTFSSKWNSTIETKELKRAAESVDAGTGIEDHTELSGEATREGAFKTFESESYKSNVILTKYFPDSQSIQGRVALDTVEMNNQDSWSFLSLGGGQIKTSGGQWFTSYEDNWDPRNVYEAQLDGIPLPPERIPSIDSHLYALPEGYKAPTSNTSGRSWTEYVIGAIAGQKGDAYDQWVNSQSGFGDSFTLGLSGLISSNNPFLGEDVDYDSDIFLGGSLQLLFLCHRLIRHIKHIRRQML